MMLGKVLSPFCTPVAKQYQNKLVYTIYPNIQCGSRVMSIFTKWPQPNGMILNETLSIKMDVTRAGSSIKIDNVNNHTYTKFDDNILCVSRVMSIFTNWPRTHSNYKSHQRSCNINSPLYSMLSYDVASGSEITPCSNIQLLTNEALGMMWYRPENTNIDRGEALDIMRYRPENTNIDRGEAEVNIGILWSISHHIQCLISQ